MNPSILTAAQEGLRLAEKHALLPHALKPLQDFQQHAHAHYADICREVLRLREVIRGVLDSATPHPIEHPNMFQAFAAARAALAQTGEEP